MKVAMTLIFIVGIVLWCWFITININYSEDTLRRWRNEGYGPPWTRMKGDHGRGEIRYPESGVEEFMRKGLVTYD